MNSEMEALINALTEASHDNGLNNRFTSRAEQKARKDLETAIQALTQGEAVAVYQWREIGEREWREAPTKEFFDNRDSDPTCDTRILYVAPPEAMAKAYGVLDFNRDDPENNNA